MKIWAKTKEFSEGKFLVVRRDGTVPHWPHFVLGARDPASPTALRAYADACGGMPGFDADYIASIRELADDFDAYRAAEGLGDPYAAPHRHDDPATLAIMRGEDGPITVRHERFNTPKALLEAADPVAVGQAFDREEERAALEAAETHSAALARALEEAKEALMPFAHAAEYLEAETEGFVDDDPLTLTYRNEEACATDIGTVLQFGHFRRARSLLAPKEDTDA